MKKSRWVLSCSCTGYWPQRPRMPLAGSPKCRRRRSSACELLIDQARDLGAVDRPEPLRLDDRLGLAALGDQLVENLPRSTDAHLLGRDQADEFGQRLG